MSDTSRKRSRKSKLVPRECTQEDAELQVTPIFKIPKSISGRKADTATLEKSQNFDILRKLSADAPADDTVQEPPIKFDVEVQIEECDDDDTSIAGRATGASKKGHNKPTSKIVITYKESKETEQDKSIPLAITLIPKTILEASSEILERSTNPADKILDIAVRNSVAHEKRGKLDDSLHLSVFEEKLQDALDAWQSWLSMNKMEDSPLFYKCYICLKSWWCLSQFCDHISKHPIVNIELEQHDDYEVNVVAYSHKKTGFREIYTEGNCLKCGENFMAHKRNNRYLKKFYNNDCCGQVFSSCFALKEHIPLCKESKVSGKQYKCTICSNGFNKEIFLNTHLLSCHTVRSDVPAICEYHTCKSCSARYMYAYLHVCCKKMPYLQCPHCYISFPNKNLVDIHLENISQPYSCNLCGEVLDMSCQVNEHMMKHSDNYMMVKKCAICEDFKVFLSDDAIIRHRNLEHGGIYAKYHCIINIIVPKSCIPGFELMQGTKNVLVLGSKTEVVPKSAQAVLPGSKDEAVPEFEDIPVLDQRQDGDVTIKVEQPDIDDKMYQNSEVDNNAEQNSDVSMADVHVKRECIEEDDEDDYEDNLIKLDIDIDDNMLTVKQETPEEPAELSKIFGTNSEYPVIVKQESLLEPEVLLRPQPRSNHKFRCCAQCGFEGTYREYRYHKEYDCLTIYSNNTIPCVCTKCEQPYSTLQKYLVHLENHGFERYACPECLIPHRNYKHLMRHVEAHIKHTFVRAKSITQDGAGSKPGFQCRKCSKVLDGCEFFLHWESHVNCNPEEVTEKSAHFETVQGSQEHSIKVSLDWLQKYPKKCNQCDREFSRIYECKRHIIEHLLTHAYSMKAVYNELRCQMCGHGFSNPHKYKQHMRDHAALPVYRCEICDRAFSDSSNFTKHKKVHNLQVFICDLCGKKFQAKLSLEKHIAIHTNTDPITCDQCDKVFYCPSSYRRHVRVLHERTCRVRCVICKERFYSLKQKWNHMWEVHKERNYKADCPICSKSFRKFSDVRSHALAEHQTGVSLLNLKHAAKSMSNRQRIYRKNNDTKLIVGAVETLIVFE